ncbi:MAG: c-type cytochrome [Bdellovibrionales bacterium]|nr:c-type cytochrome [Bdellovibrionales bacterium]
MSYSGAAHHPLVPLRVYLNTLLALLVLTVVTVGASYVDFGKANFGVAFFIASVKAALVMAFFMGLKYDSYLNRAVILGSFAALALFLFFPLADMWTRKKPDPVRVLAAAGGASEEDFKKWEAGSPDLAAKGKEVYAVNCTACHGASGKGDGPAGPAMKARDFTSPASTWKNGTSAKAIYATLKYGIPGTGMAGYGTLPPADRWALVHFVRSLATEKQAASPGDVKYAQAMKEDLASASPGGARKTVPVDFIIQRMTQQ